MMELWIRAPGIREAVQIRMDLSEKEKFPLFKAADFFILPNANLQETFGITLKELKGRAKARILGIRGLPESSAAV
jgi:hypothetical protein